MIRRSFAFLLVTFVLGLAAQAQTPAPAPGPGAKGEMKTFSMFFDGDGGYLGVQTAEVTKENFSKFGLREVRGVAIEKIVEGSPAEKAGLQNGDVIVRFNGEEVTSTRKLTRLLGEVSPDHQVKVTVVRSGEEREVVATVGKRPTPKFEDGNFTWNAPDFPQGGFPLPRVERLPRMETLPPGAPEPMLFGFGSGRRMGISVSPLTKQLSDHFGVASGVLIDEVRPDSPAAKSGLKAGDIIVEIDGKEVKSDRDIIRTVAEKKEGDVTLTIVRDRNRQTIRVTPEDVKDRFQFPAVPNGSFQTSDNFDWISLPTGAVLNGFRIPCRIF
jgi:serine protease Do